MLVTFLFTAVAAKLIYIEIAQGGELQAKAIEQWYRDVPIKAERGEIYDRNGILLADCDTDYTLYVRPIAVENKEKTARALAVLLDMNYDKVYAKVTSRSSEITLKKGVDRATVLAVVNSDATGIYVSETVKRVYPYGDFMTQILGFTNVDCEGQTGIEARYNDYIKGVDGYVLTAADLVGRELKDGKTYYLPGTKGGSARLTLDYGIQCLAENAVAQAKLNHKSKSASCIVMDCNTGELLAMAQAPSFDLNNVPRDNVTELFANSKSTLISNVFEPGSTFKIVTAAIGLDCGAVDRNYRCFCGGSLAVDGQKIKCWRTIGHGSQSFDEGVQNSCNCLFMNIALSVGAERFYRGIEAFGLNDRTGIDLSGEASGLIIPQEAVKNVDLARIGFGQAIAVTPIELLRATAAVVNGGTLVTPHVMAEITSANGETLYKAAPETVKGVIKKSTSESMREVLETVVLNGSGKNARVEGIRIGGKTGTAQKYENGVIAAGKYVSTFIGFAPADNPKYITLMVVDEPQGAYYGSIVAAPYVGQIYANLFSL